MSTAKRHFFWLAPVLSMLISLPSTAAIKQTKGDFEDKFRQLDEVFSLLQTYTVTPLVSQATNIGNNK